MYREIADYGIIGDMHSVALISRDGSIDYCSMPHIDSPTVFAALLDDEKGGYFSIRPAEEFTSGTKYIDSTNILNCFFKTKTGEAILTDFMPVKTQELFEGEDHIIHRCLRCVSGSIKFKLELFARPLYAKAIPQIDVKGKVCKIRLEKETFTFNFNLTEYDLKTIDDGIRLEFSLSVSQEAHFNFVYGDSDKEETLACGMKDTEKFWHDWLKTCMGNRCSFLGEYAGMVNRSLLALKLLTFQPTGAIAAAATTSFPETIGGKRNWDYRFTWIRDASFTLKALFALGHVDEADSFVRWLHTTYKKYGGERLQIMYSLEGNNALKEKELTFLKGYMASAPVRIGNGAHNQNQWDIYGEVMDAALRLSDYAGKIDVDLWPFFKDICELAIKNWEKPDDGIWEVRNGPYHFVYSKVMCWVALDRGIKIAARYGFDAPLNEWKIERGKIIEDVLVKGYDKDIKSFVQRYGSKELDSSLLLLPMVNFLPIDDERIKNTIKACREKLMKHGFLLRYSGDDGMEGEEGGFILCNFWFIECLVLSGEVDEAKKVIETTVKAANHLGLLSEEYDFKSGRMLGNFPQAFSHIGYINAVSAVLNAQYKGFQKSMNTPLVERFKKIIPLRAELNKTNKRQAEHTPRIAAQLKILLGRLQGAFFNVIEGRVDYESMKRSSDYMEYLNLTQKLNFFDPSLLKTDAEKRSFWINMYNILIIHGVIEFDVKESVKEIFNFFGRISYKIGGFNFTPDDIEHGILRKNRPHPVIHMKPFSSSDKRLRFVVDKFDPRVHFALVCASSSCPPIEFYEASKINQQLDVAGKSFINRRGAILDPDNNVLSLSQIFKWYAPDFGSSIKNIVKYITNFTNEKIKNYLLNNQEKLQVKYLPYDWSLNKILK